MNRSPKANQTAWIGLDVDSKNVVAAVDRPLVTGEARVRPSQLPVETFERSCDGLGEMLAWAASQFDGEVELRVVMESTGSYSEDVHTWLCEIAPQTGPAIINPKIMKDFLQSLDPRTKSDRVDSQGIARYGTERVPDAKPPMSEGQRKLRELMRSRELLITHRDALRNHLASTRDKECQRIVESSIKHCDKQIERMLDKAVRLARKDKRLSADLARLMEIFGVAEVTALTVLAEVGDLRRFKSSKQLASFCGLTPRIEESGGKSKRPRLSKFGNPNLRRVLYMAAVVVVRFKNKTDMGRWYQTAVERGMPPRKALVGVMRKLLDRMYLMVTTTKTYEHFPLSKPGSSPVEAV